MTDCTSAEEVFFAGLCLYTICAAHQQRGTFTQEYNISNGDESEAERLERLLVEEAVARRIEVSHVNKTAQLTGGVATNQDFLGFKPGWARRIAS